MRLGLAAAALLVVVLIVWWARREDPARAAAERETAAVAAARTTVEARGATGHVKAPDGRGLAGVLVLAVEPAWEEIEEPELPPDSGDVPEEDAVPQEETLVFRAVPWGAWTLTDDEGRYGFPDGDRELIVLALAADGSCAWTPWILQEAELGLRAPVRRGGVVLRAEDGQPLEGASVAADLPGLFAAHFGAAAGVRLRELLRDAAADPRAAACVNATMARTTEDGRFELAVGAAQEVVATAPGCDTDRAEVRPGSAEVGPLVLGPGGGVRGIVREPNGTPVVGALVELYPEGTFDHSYGPPDGHRATVSDAEGRFELAGLPDGVRYRAEAHHPRREVHAARVAEVDGAPVDLVLRPWPRIEAFVDYGEWRGPVDCFGVHLAGGGLREPVPLNRADLDRFDSVPLNLPPGTYEVRLVAGENCGPLATRQIELPETGTVTVRDLRVPGDTCVLRLRTGRFDLREAECGGGGVKTDARGLASVDGSKVESVVFAGEPIPLRRGELVDLDLADRLASRARVRLPALDATIVDVEVIGHGTHEMGRRALPPDGALEFKSRDRASIKVSVAAEGRTPWIRDIAFTDTRDVVLDAELPPLRHARVRLVDAEGRALPGVPLELQDRDGIVAGHAEATTDAEGRAVLPVLPTSELRLVESPFVLVQHVRGEDLDTEGETTLRAARSGAIRGVWRSWDQREGDSALLLGIVDQKLLVPPIIETDHAGRFHVQGLPPGTYLIQEFLTATWAVEVAAGRTTVVTLR